jgi:hypothetical protein
MWDFVMDKSEAGAGFLRELGFPCQNQNKKKLHILLKWLLGTLSVCSRTKLKLASWIWALLEKLPTVQLLRNFPAVYGTRRFVTVFMNALYWSLSWARSIQSIPPRPISLRSILILIHLRQALHGGLFPSGFPPNSYMCSASSLFVLHALPILFSWTSYEVLVMQFSPPSCHFIPLRHFFRNCNERTCRICSRAVRYVVQLNLH